MLFLPSTAAVFSGLTTMAVTHTVEGAVQESVGECRRGQRE